MPLALTGLFHHRVKTSMQSPKAGQGQWYGDAQEERMTGGEDRRIERRCWEAPELLLIGTYLPEKNESKKDLCKHKQTQLSPHDWTRTKMCPVRHAERGLNL